MDRPQWAVSLETSHTTGGELSGRWTGPAAHERDPTVRCGSRSCGAGLVVGVVLVDQRGPPAHAEGVLAVPVPVTRERRVARVAVAQLDVREARGRRVLQVIADAATDAEGVLA